MAILVWAPLPFASNRIWSGALLAALLAVVLVAWLLLYTSGRVSLGASLWSHVRLPLALLVLVQLWVLLQMQPLPAAWVALLSPQAHAWHIGQDWLSLSLDREYTRYYLLRGCAFTSGFFLTLALVNSAARLKIVLQVLVFSGTLQATYGAFMVLSGLELGFFVEKYGGRGAVTGTFVNRNHMAGYLVMTLSAGIGLLLSQIDLRTFTSWRERARSWLRLLLSPGIRLRMYLAIMIIALVLTQSRMGNIAFFVALAIAGSIALYTGQRFSRRVVTFLASLCVVDLLILGRWFGADKLLHRLERSGEDMEGRFALLNYTLDYIRAFPLTGSGGGSFYGIFANFQGAELPGYHVHAHNDYMEFAAELGLPITLVLLLFVLSALVCAFQVLRLRKTALYRGAAFAVTMTLAWAAMHSLTDFNLQIPANALTFVTILALAFVCRVLPPTQHFEL